jgi:hypothetical protein
VDTPGEYWFVSPTYRQSKEIAWKLLFELLPQGAAKKINETELSCTLINGSIIKLKGADNEDSLRGVGLNGVVLDEYAFMKPNVWEEIIRPMLFDSCGWAMFISTPKGYNHFYKLWEQASEKDWCRFHYTTFDNPYIDELEIQESKQTMTSTRFDQEIMAEFTTFEGAVWPMFRRDVHLVPTRTFNKETQHYAAIDFGYAKGHPTAFGVFECNNQGDVCLIDGFLTERLDPDQINEQILLYTKHLTLRGIYYDSARPDLADYYSKKGLPMLPADKDVELGLARVAEFLNINPITNKPRFTMCEHLTPMIQQIENYEWLEVKSEDGKFKQQPKKENDDTCDMIRYFLFTHTQSRKQVKSYVMTGGDPVTGFGRRRVAKRGGIEAEMGKLFR